MSADLRGRHIVITGATSGLGLSCAHSLAAMGASLTIVVRNQKKGEELVADIHEASGNEDIELEICDMLEGAEVHALADRLIAKGEPVDVLINNAGALFNERGETSEGYERSFALLLLSPYILTERLFPLLDAAESARVINVSSGGMYSQRIHVDDLQFMKTEYSGPVAYARAKRGLMIVTEEWAQRWKDNGIVVNAMHPGWADTPGVEDSLPGFHRIMSRLLRTPEEGADTIVWLAAATEAAGVTGQFWLDRQAQPAHMFERTRETPEKRESLLTHLHEMSATAAA